MPLESPMAVMINRIRQAETFWNQRLE